MRNVLLAVFLLPITSLASADELAPGKADIVLQCHFDGKPSKGCVVTCGSELDRANGGKAMVYDGVDLVEIYHKGAIGRTDTRSLLLARHTTTPTPGSGFVLSLYFGPPVFCHWFAENTKFKNGQHEFRAVRFAVN